jgi:c-di-GMP-related signal transduction protein
METDLKIRANAQKLESLLNCFADVEFYTIEIRADEIRLQAKRTDENLEAFGEIKIPKQFEKLTETGFMYFSMKFEYMDVTMIFG